LSKTAIIWRPLRTTFVGFSVIFTDIFGIRKVPRLPRGVIGASCYAQTFDRTEGRTFGRQQAIYHYHATIALRSNKMLKTAIWKPELSWINELCALK